MFKPLTDVVLVAVMLIQDPVTQKFDLKYTALDYYRTFAECYIEEKRLTKKNIDTRRAYICVRIDKD
jgi:hypothetical protein